MYRILLCSAPTAIGFCVAAFVVGFVGCKQQEPATVGTVPLSEVAVSSEVEATEQSMPKSIRPSMSQNERTEEPVHAVVVVEVESNDSEFIDPSEPILRVSVSGVRSTDGVYFCALFDSEEKFEKRSDALISEKFPATESEITWEIESLAPGRYSIAAFHDANENGKVDRHALGYPIEAYGFSNNARGKFGPPAYEKVEFEIGAEPKQLSIKLK